MTEFAAIFHVGGKPVERDWVAVLARELGQPSNGKLIIEGTGSFACAAVAAANNNPAGVICLRDRELTIVARVRLDNRPELLAALGPDAPPRRDGNQEAGLIAAAYRRWGRSFLTYLIGDFALVLYDSTDSRLIAARDALGVRTLYYARAGELVLLSSRALCLAHHPDLGARISRKALMMWVLNGYDDRVSMFAGVAGLAAGQGLLATGGKVQTWIYWSPATIGKTEYKDYHAAAADLKTLLKRCITDRCQTESTLIATMLSGGLDSSAVTALAHSQVIALGKRLAPVSFQFNRLASCDESRLSRATARFLGLDTYFVDCESFWIFQNAFNQGPVQENPFISWDSMDRHIFTHLSNLGSNVLLTGQAGDNLMTGLIAPFLLGAEVWRGRIAAMSPLIREIRTRGLGLGYGLRRYLVAPRLPAGLKIGLKRWMRRAPFRPAWVGIEAYRHHAEVHRLFGPWPRVFHDVDRQLAFEMMLPMAAGVRRAVHWFDRMAQPYGIDVRHPFLDRRLVEFMLALPQAQVTAEGRAKGLLRLALMNELPAEVLRREDKPGLLAYYHLGIERERQNIFALLNSSALAKLGLIDTGPLKARIRDYLAEDPNSANADFLSTISAEIWLRSALEAGFTLA